MEIRYATIVEGFDRIASTYDERYSASANPIKAWMRAESLRILQRVLPPKGWVLEIGCGTGEETMALVRAGYRVLATDISPRMLHCARARMASAGLEDRVTFVAIPAGDLAALRPPEPFDGAYAGFGPLNCEPHLTGLARALADLLRPGAPLVISVVNAWCLFEALQHLAHGRIRAFLQGRGNGWRLIAMPGPDGKQVAIPTRPLSTGVLRGAFCPFFRIEHVMAFPLLLPPPPAADLFRRHAAWFGGLELLDRILRARWPWREWGDHVLMILRRR